MDFQDRRTESYITKKSLDAATKNKRRRNHLTTSRSNFEPQNALHFIML